MLDWFRNMFKPKNKQELISLLKEKSFKILLTEEGKAAAIADMLKKLSSKQVTVLVLE